MGPGAAVLPVQLPVVFRNRVQIQDAVLLLERITFRESFLDERGAMAPSRLPVVQFTQARFIDNAEAIERKLGTVLQCDINHSRNEQVQAFERRTNAGV